MINEIVYGSQIDEVLCSLDNVDTAHYYHQDALQSVTVITDGFANKSAIYEYDVYGKIKDKTGTFYNEIDLKDFLDKLKNSYALSYSLEYPVY